MLDFVTPRSELMVQNEPLTMQEVLDQAYAFLLKQGHRSYNRKYNMCSYRAPDGAKCAIGYFMTDYEYSPEFETRPINNITIPHKLRHLPIEFLSALQIAHDNTDTVSSFAADLQYQFDKLANYFGLKFPG